MGFINFMFCKDKKFKRADPSDPKHIIEYEATADYYEAKCDAVLRKKFPATSKFLNRITQIFSMFIIVIILMI